MVAGSSARQHIHLQSNKIDCVTPSTKGGIILLQQLFYSMKWMVGNPRFQVWHFTITFDFKSLFNWLETPTIKLYSKHVTLTDKSYILHPTMGSSLKSVTWLPLPWTRRRPPLRHVALLIPPRRKFCTADVPLSPGISQSAPTAGWERRAIQLPRSNMFGSSGNAYPENIRSRQFRFPGQLGSLDTRD